MNIKIKDGKLVGEYPALWDGDFDCHAGVLTSLEGAPIKINGDFYCHRNNLHSLDGGPTRVTGDFLCDINKLTSLKGGPIQVGGNFYCNSNKLTSLKGAPSIVGGNFGCYDNSITSIQNIHHYIKKIGRDFLADYDLSGLISLLMIEHPSEYAVMGPLSDIFNDALGKIHAGQDRMEAILEVILNTPEEHAWQLGDIE